MSYGGEEGIKLGTEVAEEGADIFHFYFCCHCSGEGCIYLDELIEELEESIGWRR